MKKSLIWGLLIVVVVFNLTRAQLVNQTNSSETTTTTMITQQATSQSTSSISTTLSKIAQTSPSQSSFQVVYETDTKLEVIVNWILGLLIAMIVIFAICIMMTVIFICVTNYFHK